VEVRVGQNDYGRTVNPELWLEPRPGHGTLAGLVVGPDGSPLPEARLTLYRTQAPNTPVRYLATYPAHQVNPDPAWGENYATGELPAGGYIVQVWVGSQLHRVEATVLEGRTTWVEIPGR
jgi:hypothetical protein